MKQKRVAYFCMEFGLHEDFHIYAGGLGILAGDLLKAAHDARAPLVGIGLLWRQGYTSQRIDETGFPYDRYYENRYPFLEDTGKEVRVEIRKKSVRLKIWKCTQFDNVPLYLLDANLPDNTDALLTGQLYGWFPEERLAQEIMLGVGGVRALIELGIETDMYHFNDSHPVVAGLELIRMNMDKGMSFAEAWEAVRKKIVFTTHTPIIQGNEYYEYDILEYMGILGEEKGESLTIEEMKQIGSDPFSMTEAGLRLSKRANAVAQLHGETARNMWAHVRDSAPILAITNGVHNGTWQDERVYRARQDGEALWKNHQICKRETIQFIRERTGVTLREDVLTIGFARRAAPYKRSDLIFRDEEAIAALLKEGKLQLVFSGKAHPNDLKGKEIIANLVQKTKEYPESVVFIQDYGIDIGRALTRGCDVWLNNPIRPMEASGTSGMKAAMNGVLNCSTLDGWWPEGYVHGETGWQIGDGYEGEDSDAHDLKALIHVLKDEILPCYYKTPEKWRAMMQKSIEMATDAFSAKRMLDEYYAQLYNE